MTENDIIKALACCSKPYCNDNKCPLHKNTVNTKDCITQLSTNALDLINRKNAEIEQYIARIANDTEYTERIERENRKQREELERLTEENKELNKAKAINPQTTGLRPCYVKGAKALFHKWVQRRELLSSSIARGGHNGGEVEFTLALVEFENGQTYEVHPKDIRFADSAGLFKQFAFDEERQETAKGGVIK